MKQGNKISISLGMLFSLLRQPNFNFSDIQVSRRHPVPKYEIRNTFYRITWKVNIVENLASLCNIAKQNFLPKDSMENLIWKLVQGPF